jgi:hypothetical protein
VIPAKLPAGSKRAQQQRVVWAAQRSPRPGKLKIKAGAMAASKDIKGLDMSLDAFIKMQAEEKAKRAKLQPQDKQPPQQQQKQQGAQGKPFGRPGQAQQGGRGRGNGHVGGGGRGGFQQQRPGFGPRPQQGFGPGNQQAAMQQQQRSMAGGIAHPSLAAHLQQQQMLLLQHRAMHQQQMQQQQQQAKQANNRLAPRCYFDRATQEVVVKVKDVPIVTIKQTGDAVLNSGGWATQATLQAMNDSLAAIGIRITANGDVSAGNWSVTDGRSLARFSDGMVVPAKGGMHQSRGEQVLQAFQMNKQQGQGGMGGMGGPGLEAAAMGMGMGPGAGMGMGMGAGLGVAGSGAAAPGVAQGNGASESQLGHVALGHRALGWPLCWRLCWMRGCQWPQGAGRRRMALACAPVATLPDASTCVTPPAAACLDSCRPAPPLPCPPPQARCWACSSSTCTCSSSCSCSSSRRGRWWRTSTWWARGSSRATERRLTR